MIDKDNNTIPDREPLIACNAFSLTKTVRGIEAIGKRLVNLLFQEKGTCFDDFDMGVGIKLFLYERLKSSQLNMLEELIAEQVNRYMEDAKVDSCETNYITPIDSKSSVGGTTLEVKFYFKEPIEGKNILSVRLDKKQDSPDITTSFFVG